MAVLAVAVTIIACLLVLLRVVASYQAQTQHLVDQIVCLKVDPATAIQTIDWQPEGDNYISPMNDTALAEDESA